VTIESLVKVVPPPTIPDEAYYGPWEPIEAELGTALPQDYKDFVRLYGEGSFMEIVGIHVPRTKSPYVRLELEAHVVRKLFLDDEEEHPYAFWPEPGGLLVCGKTDFGDCIFWLTAGPPSDWRIVVWDRGFREYESFDCGLTEFLAGLATGAILPKNFPDDLEGVQPFRRYSDPAPISVGGELAMPPGAPSNVEVKVSWTMGTYGASVGSARCRMTVRSAH
jgi:hypothetical protein